MGYWIRTHEKLILKFFLTFGIPTALVVWFFSTAYTALLVFGAFVLTPSVLGTILQIPYMIYLYKRTGKVQEEVVQEEMDVDVVPLIWYLTIPVLIFGSVAFTPVVGITLAILTVPVLFSLYFLVWRW